MRTANASPSPNCCSPGTLPTTKPANDAAITSAAAVIRRPVRSSERDGFDVVAARPRLAHPRYEEHLVVHREAEERREEEDRDPAFDLCGAIDSSSPAPIPKQLQGAVAGRNRDQVQQHGLQREQRERNARKHPVRDASAIRTSHGRSRTHA
jgi:hypothetical protein